MSSRTTPPPAEQAATYRRISGLLRLTAVPMAVIAVAVYLVTDSVLLAACVAVVAGGDLAMSFALRAMADRLDAAADPSAIREL